MWFLLSTQSSKIWRRGGYVQLLGRSLKIRNRSFCKGGPPPRAMLGMTPPPGPYSERHRAEPGNPGPRQSSGESGCHQALGDVVGLNFVNKSNDCK